MCFPVNIAKFLRTPVLKSICERLLLDFGVNNIYSECNHIIYLVYVRPKSPLKTLVRPVFENILTSMYIFSKTYFSLHKNNKLKNRTETDVSQSRVCRNR